MKHKLPALSAAPSWRYVDETLLGPSPVPPVPAVTSIHAGEFSADPVHRVAQVDQERGVVTLGVDRLPHPWHEEAVDRPFRLASWRGAGWYAVYRRRGRRFELSRVWADGWAWQAQRLCNT